jgi:sec-independent protein translocase protein TatB
VFNLGMGEITVILLLALIFLGPKKLPELASGLGKFIREIRKTTADVKNEIQLDDAIRKPFEELRDAVTLHPEELKRRDLIKKQMEEVRRAAEEASAAADAAVATAVEPPPPTSGDATIIQQTPIIGIAPEPSGKIVDISAPPVGTVARSGQGGPAHAPSTGTGSTSRYGAPPTPAPTGATPDGPSIAERARTPRPTSPGLPRPRQVTPPVSTSARGDATQILSEADILPSGNAPSMFPPPPPAPSGTAKMPGVTSPPPTPSPAAPVAANPTAVKKTT